MSALLEDLRRSGAYPEPRPAAVELVTTHSSWVFLAGDEVWKLKRPVSYGFLDYGDSAKRHEACEGEVRLGQRLAPGVYRGVVPVFRGPDGFSFAGPGAVVDHAVRMVRLPEQESALSLARAHALGPAQIRALCERLAAFYASAPRRDAFGEARVLEAEIEENRLQTLPFCERFIDRGTLEAVYAWQKAALARGAARLRRRAGEGRVREGHGDLRLEHVYFLSARQGAPVVIDPIEFNAAFRCKDVALDVAFLAMDLAAEQQGALGEYLLARFAMASQDYGFFPLAELFLSHRAWVRAKVACFVAGDASTPPEKARRKIEEAARLIHLARAFAEGHTRTGTVVVVSGMIGTGKSTLAEALGRALGAPVVSSDPTRKALAGLEATTRGGSDLYDEETTTRTYRQIFHAADEVLASGRDVILDATFAQARLRQGARELTARHGCRLLFLALDADDETLRQRLRARGEAPSVSDAREELLPLLRSRFEPPRELGPAELVPVDARAPTDAIVEAVVGRLPAAAAVAASTR